MHQRATCAAKEFQYTPDGYCRFCLGIKEDTGGADDHGGMDKCKMKKRLHRFFRHCYREKYGNPINKGESYVKFMKDIFANRETYYSKIVELADEQGISY